MKRFVWLLGGVLFLTACRKSMTPADEKAVFVDRILEAQLSSKDYSTIDNKLRRVISATFPRKLVFNGDWFRITGMNEPIYLIYTVAQFLAEMTAKILVVDYLKKLLAVRKGSKKALFRI